MYAVSLCQCSYSSGLEVRILKNLGSTDRILKAKIREFFFFLAFCPVNILSVGVQILEPNRFFLTNILSSSPALYSILACCLPSSQKLHPLAACQDTCYIMNLAIPGPNCTERHKEISRGPGPMFGR